MLPSFSAARILLASAALLGGLALAATAPASGSCSFVAAPDGSDAASGNEEQPFGSAQALVDSLQPGQTGCLRSGTYAADSQVKISTPGVRLMSYPGEQATLRTRLWVAREGDGVTVADLALDGRSPSGLPSPTINADDVVLRRDDMTNHHTGICVQIGSAATWGRAHDTLIEASRIHDCGELPATNQDHGIYVEASDDAVIRDNFIYGNADRGIQLYPDAQGTEVTGNVIDGNGEGVIFSGADGTASSNNVVEHNVITNSRIRANVESWWEAGAGTGNVVRYNCIGGGPEDDGDGGITGGAAPGFTAGKNLLRVPYFSNVGELSIPASAPCARLLAGGEVNPG